MLLSDSQYFPNVNYFFILSDATNCCFDLYERYQKMSFRNRCVIAGANGAINLSIPIVGGRGQRAIMKDVRISNDENWQANHWKTIMSAYNKSPFLDHFRHELERLYSRKFEFLVDWNLETFRWICDKMSCNCNILVTERYEPEVAEGWDDWRGRVMPATVNKLFPHSKRYPQVFEDRQGFLPNLSILDYLLCSGG